MDQGGDCQQLKDQGQVITCAKIKGAIRTLLI